MDQIFTLPLTTTRWILMMQRQNYQKKYKLQLTIAICSQHIYEDDYLDGLVIDNIIGVRSESIRLPGVSYL